MYYSGVPEPGLSLKESLVSSGGLVYRFYFVLPESGSSKGQVNQNVLFWCNWTWIISKGKSCHKVYSDLPEPGSLLEDMYTKMYYSCVPETELYLKKSLVTRFILVYQNLDHFWRTDIPILFCFTWTWITSRGQVNQIKTSIPVLQIKSRFR